MRPTRPRAAWLWLGCRARGLLPESLVPVKKCSSAICAGLCHAHRGRRGTPRAVRPPPGAEPLGVRGPPHTPRRRDTEPDGRGREGPPAVVRGQTDRTADPPTRGGPYEPSRRRAWRLATSARP